MSFPPDRTEVSRWFADHPRHWLAGEAYRFAIELDGQVLGMTSLDAISEGQANLGYWLDRAHWARLCV